MDYNYKSITRFIAKCRLENKKIVFTNGIFDLFHCGHLESLKQSKKFGDILIVGINSDYSTNKIKPGRPIINENQRAEIVRSIKWVDYVIIFNEFTPNKLIQIIQPDIITKGDDYKVKDLYEMSKEINSEKIEFKLISRTDVSTTKIIQKIINENQ